MAALLETVSPVKNNEFPVSTNGVDSMHWRKHGEDVMPGEVKNTESHLDSIGVYEQSQFVGREEGIEEIRKQIEKRIKIDKNKPVAIHLMGERGVGKTWLMLHLHRTKLPELAVVKTSFFIDFDRDRPVSQLDPVNNNNEYRFPDTENEKNLIDLMKWLLDRLSGRYYSDSGIPDLSDRLRRSIANTLTENQVLVLLLDGIYSRSGNFLDLIETHLLKPLFDQQVLFILSGRGRPYDWIAPELRLDSPVIRLKPFSPEEVSELLGRITEQEIGVDSELLKTNYRISGGYPLTSLKLANAESEDISNSLDAIIQYLFSFIGNEAERSEMIHYVKALSILNPWDAWAVQTKKMHNWGFRRDAVRYFLNEYFKLVEVKDENDGIRRVDGFEAMRILNELTRERIVRWDQDLNGYMIDGALRFPVVAYLERNEPALLIHLHESAIAYYTAHGEESIAEVHQKALDSINTPATKAH